MPPFTPDRFNPSITDAEKNAVEELNDDAVNLSCRWQRMFVCVCVATLFLPVHPLHQFIHDHGRYCPEECPTMLTGRASVCFEWSFKGYGHSETFKQKMRCDNAIKSVPFPQPWRTAIRVVTRIDRMRRDAIVEASRLIEFAVRMPTSWRSQTTGSLRRVMW